MSLSRPLRQQQTCIVQRDLATVLAWSAGRCAPLHWILKWKGTDMVGGNNLMLWKKKKRSLWKEEMIGERYRSSVNYTSESFAPCGHQNYGSVSYYDRAGNTPYVGFRRSEDLLFWTVLPPPSEKCSDLNHLVLPVNGCRINSQSVEQFISPKYVVDWSLTPTGQGGLAYCEVTLHLHPRITIKLGSSVFLLDPKESVKSSNCPVPTYEDTEPRFSDAAASSKPASTIHH